MDSARCERCGQTVRVRKDGGLYKHQAAGGVDCVPADPVAGPAAAGLDVSGPSPQTHPEGSEGTVSNPAGEQAEGIEQPDDAGDGEDGGRGEQADEPLAGVEVRYTVAAPCPYLDDPAWHHANAELALRRALRDGHTATGPVRHTGTHHDGNRIVVTYLVPTT